MDLIKSVEIIDVDNPLRWRADIDLFSKLYPKEFKSYIYQKTHDPDRDEKELTLEIFQDDEDKLWEFVDKLSSIRVTLHDGEAQEIANFSIYEIHKGYLEHMSVSFENRFIFCFLTRAADQAGSIGIWDTQLENWCFSYFNDYCFESIKYHELDDIFTGNYFWNLPFIGGGEGKFLVTKERKFVDLES